MKAGQFVIVLSVCAVLWACRSEGNVNYDQLTGVWEVVEAQRNGRMTETLNGALFTFDRSQNLVTNLTGTDNKGSFELIDNVIIHRTRTEVAYAIQEMNDTSMTLSAKLQGMHFGLHLKKQKE